MQGDGTVGNVRMMQGGPGFQKLVQFRVARAVVGVMALLIYLFYFGQQIMLWWLKWGGNVNFFQPTLELNIVEKCPIWLLLNCN